MNRDRDNHSTQNGTNWLTAESEEAVDAIYPAKNVVRDDLLTHRDRDHVPENCKEHLHCRDKPDQLPDRRESHGDEEYWRS